MAKKLRMFEGIDKHGEYCCSFRHGRIHVKVPHVINFLQTPQHCTFNSVSRSGILCCSDARACLKGSTRLYTQIFPVRVPTGTERAPFNPILIDPLSRLVIELVRCAACPVLLYPHGSKLEKVYWTIGQKNPTA